MKIIHASSLLKENVPPSAKIIAVTGSKALGEMFSDISIPQNQKKSTLSGEKTSNKRKVLINIENNKRGKILRRI
jgi:hypothetical protein